jgi:FAD/FMN-containing dehydrogenase
MTLNETLAAGRLHWPGDAGYEAQRLPWQRKFDPRPAAVLDARDAQDVRAALEIAHDNALPVAVQATGHGAVAPADDALLLRTSAMSAVAVDPRRRIARAGGGATWADVIAAAAPHGLAPLSGTAVGVGVAGYTLGGGAGLLSRTFGYAADSLVSADVVTAEGEQVTAAADQNADLFWALKGGGGSFGVVTALEFRLYAVEALYGGISMFDPARARAVLEAYREWAPAEPDESNLALVVMTMPPLPQIPEPVRGRRVLMLRTLYVGEASEGERLLAPLLAAAGEPILDGFGPLAVGDALTMMGPSPPPAVAEVHLELLRELPDEVLDVATEDNGPAIEVRQWGGAMARGDGPIGHRDIPYSCVATALAPDRDGWAAAKASVERVGARVRPHATGASFLNFLGDGARAADAYTPEDYARLREVKTAYDPGNVFRLGGHSIPPV